METPPHRPPRPPRDSLEAWLDDRGRLSRWPTRSVPRQRALDFLAAQLEADREYSEGELTVLLLKHHGFNDPALLRRNLVDSGRLQRERDGSRYRRVPGLSAER